MVSLALDLSGRTPTRETSHDSFHRPVLRPAHNRLSRTAPDPDGAQYRALLEACDELLSLKGLTPRKLFLWIEYAAPTEGPDRIFHALTAGCARVVRAAT